MEVALPLERVAKIANVDAVEQVEVIQSLWSGYGQIVRVRLQPAGPDQTGANTVIVKYVDPPESRGHKYGWSGNVSHQRKLSSCLLYTSPSPRDQRGARMPSSA